MSGSSRLPSIRNLVHGSDSDSSPSRGDGRGHAASSSSASRGAQRPLPRPLMPPVPYPSSSSSSHQRDDENRLARLNFSMSERPREHRKLPSISEMLAPAPIRIPVQASVGNTQPESQPKRQATTSGYPCERCGRLFSRKADALKHIRVVHDRVKNFSCSVCGRQFGRKDYCTVS